MESGVIMKVSEPSKWYAEGKFVEKKVVNVVAKLCLVVDFRKLNENVSRPLRQFQTIAEIRYYVEVDSQYFMAVDMAHGYHQRALSD